jgi:hypothetical protein
MILVICVGVSWRSSKRSRRRASTSASTPDPADRSGRSASTVCAAPMRHQRRESRQDRGAVVAVYPVRVPGGCWVSRCASTTATQPMTGAAPSRTCCTVPRLRPGCFPRGRSPRRHYVSRPRCPFVIERRGLGRASRRRRGRPASSRSPDSASAGRSSSVRPAPGPGSARPRCVAVRGGPARWARGRGATTT